jgi:hypothetical protein
MLSKCNLSGDYESQHNTYSVTRIKIHILWVIILLKGVIKLNKYIIMCRKETKTNFILLISKWNLFSWKTLYNSRNSFLNESLHLTFQLRPCFKILSQKIFFLGKKHHFPHRPFCFSVLEPIKNNLYCLLMRRKRQ